MGCCLQGNQVIIIRSIKTFKTFSKYKLRRDNENFANRQFSFSDYSEFIDSSSSSDSSFNSDKQSEIPIDGRIENANELIFL